MFAFETIFENILAETVSTETQQIARGLRQRDLALLRALVEQYQYRLVRYLIYLLGRRDPVDDLVQETWLRVLERGRSYDGQSPFAPWLFTIARNLAIDSLRKRRIFSLDSSAAAGGARGAGSALSGRLVAGGDRRHRRRVCFHRIVADLSRPGNAASAHARSTPCKLNPMRVTRRVTHRSAR
jgi:RNA polymerase sigma factor (sigma-70 family)